MWRPGLKYRRFAWPLIALALLFYNPNIYSQEKISKDSVFTAGPDRIIKIPGYKTFVVDGAVIKIPETPIPARLIQSKHSFYDSLKIKASKYLITKKLYDFMIVPERSGPARQMTESSESYFRKYSGMRIRNIDVRRLNIFGSDINNPDVFNPSKAETILNKTHLNTNEFIIRKNLLFSSGDTVSPLTLSDNERLLRQLPFIEDSRIRVVPVTDKEADIIVITKDVYSIGGSFEYPGIKKGTVSLFDKNLLGIGHEFKIDVPYNSSLPDSPGFGLNYYIDNIFKSFTNLDLYYYNGLGKKTYGFDMERKLISSATKYAGGISFRQMHTTEDLDTLSVPEPLNYNLQDFWLARSFLINRESVTRIIIGARYTNNIVFDRPFILPDSYHYLQDYRLFLGSAAFSTKKYYKTNLIYSYGPTEDIPYGGMFKLTMGSEINEFDKRTYAGVDLAAGKSVKTLGYFYSSVGLSSFFTGGHTEQGLLKIKTGYFSNLIYMNSFRVRNFVRLDYTRGFDRNTDERLAFIRDGGFSSFKNDSLRGNQRLTISLESVIFSPVNYYGFRFAFFVFGDLGFLFGTNQIVKNGDVLSSIGLGIRVRNDNLVFNTFQIRIGFYPNLPAWSKVSYVTLSGEKLLHPDDFEPGPPLVVPYN